MKHRLLFLLCALLLMSRASAKKPQPPSSSGVVDARLVNGDRHCSGHLEMKHQGQWRTLMLRSSVQSYRVGFAEMACRQMGCGVAVSVTVHINTTAPKPAWDVYFPCNFSDLTIRECRKAASNKTVKDVESTVSSTIVECSESLRLKDRMSSNPCYGEVMVKSSQNWIHVCESESPQTQELMLKMMCAELGCGPPSNTSQQWSWFNQFPVKTKELETGVESRIIQCHGNETRIEECPTSDHSHCKRVLHITCTNPVSVRLVGGSRCKGVLQGKNGREWRPLKHPWFSFRQNQLTDLCKILGCEIYLWSNIVYLSQEVPLWKTAVECNDRSTFCYDWEDTKGSAQLNVVCTAAVRQRGPYPCTGYVEVKHEGDWRSLCHDGFTPRDAFVGCRDLDCGFPREPREPPKSRHEVRNALSLNCRGHEEHFGDCPVSSLPTGGADDECDAAYLSCGKLPIMPELTMFSTLVDVQQKTLVEYPYSYRYRQTYTHALYVAYSGHPVIIICSIDSPSQVRSFVLEFHSGGIIEQKGNQSGVDNAAHFVFETAELNPNGSYHCRYDYEFRPFVYSEPQKVYFGVKEPSYVRLVGEASRCLGRLELEHEGEWRGVSQENWGLKEAAVVCRQLHCGSVISTHIQSPSRELKPVWRLYSDCDGSEKALLGCGSVKEWLSSTTVHVLCSDIVAPPNITVLADRLYPENTEHIVVHEGHSFFVNCSVEPRFPGGHFTLVFSGSEKLNLSEAVINSSAVFKFREVSKNHSGSYSCFYHNTVSQHSFTFESKNITITVEVSGDIMLDDGLQRNKGPKACSGTLLMRDGTSQMKMVTAETSGWDMGHASIVCRQLRCGNAVSTSKNKLQTFKSMWRFFSDCDGYEAALLDCGHIDEWFSSTAIQVVCAGNS